MKKIIETLRRKWAEYLLEMIVIIFSILGAFTLDNWNEARNNKLEEQKVLLEIRNNLMSGVSSMDIALSMDTGHLKSTKLIIDYLSNNKPYSNELVRAFGGFPFGRIFPIPKSGYSTLQSKGVGIIQNDSLRAKISNLFDTTYPYLLYVEENDVNIRRNELLKSELYEHFMLTRQEFGDTTSLRLPIDYEALMDDARFESLVRSLANNRLWFMGMKKEANDEMKNLIFEIEKELSLNH